MLTTGFTFFSAANTRRVHKTSSEMQAHEFVLLAHTHTTKKKHGIKECQVFSFCRFNLMKIMFGFSKIIASYGLKCDELMNSIMGVVSERGRCEDELLLCGKMGKWWQSTLHIYYCGWNHKTKWDSPWCLSTSTTSMPKNFICAVHETSHKWIVCVPSSSLLFVYGASALCHLLTELTQ